jgi:hypothetical protein
MAAFVESGNALKGRRRRICTLGKILVAVETDRNPDLGFGAGISSGYRWLQRVVLRYIRRQGYAQNRSAATHSHVIAESDLGRHVEGEFDRRSLGEGCVGEEEDAARTDVLGKSPGLDPTGEVANENRKKKRKALSGAAFDSDWRRIHGGKLPSCRLAGGSVRGKRTLPHVRPVEQLLSQSRANYRNADRGISKSPSRYSDAWIGSTTSNK